MMTIGSRELKTRLGTYLRQVQEGASLIITDRGRPVAELRPLPDDYAPIGQRLERLATLGLVQGELADPQPLPPFEPVESQASVSEALLEDREDRF